MLDWMSRWWLEAAMGVIAGVLTLGYRWISRTIKKVYVEYGVLRAGIKALLYDRIVQAYHYYWEKGYWPIEARETMAGMSAQYYALGGNGVVKDLIDALRELPNEKSDAST